MSFGQFVIGYITLQVFAVLWLSYRNWLISSFESNNLRGLN